MLLMDERRQSRPWTPERLESGEAAIPTVIREYQPLQLTVNAATSHVGYSKQLKTGSPPVRAADVPYVTFFYGSIAASGFT